MTWLPEHVQARYASGMVVVIPADHRGYEHAVVTLSGRTSAKRTDTKDAPTCVTLRGAPICDCGMYALDWTGIGPRDDPARTNGKGTA